MGPKCWTAVACSQETGSDRAFLCLQSGSVVLFFSACADKRQRELEGWHGRTEPLTRRVYAHFFQGTHTHMRQFEVDRSVLGAPPHPPVTRSHGQRDGDGFRVRKKL